MPEITLGDLLRQETVSNLDTDNVVIEYIPLKLIDPDPRNFYKLSDLDELVQNIELLGLQQPLLVRTHPDKPDRVIVVSGHRRREALRRLVKEGHEKYMQVPCIRQRNTGSPAMQELCLIYANSATRTLTSGETAKQVDRTTFLLYELKNEGVEFPGKMRDHVAQACNVSASKVARINAIKSNLIPEYYSQYLSDKLQESAAYTLSRFPQDFQRRLLKALPKVSSNIYMEQLLERYQSGWRWDPHQWCPDGTLCKRGDTFLRHDAECNRVSHCGGNKCCLTCGEFNRNYSPCERACSKAKAARKEKNDKKKAKEEKAQAKKLKKTQQLLAARAARLVIAADAAKLADKVKVACGYYYTDWTVGRLRKIAAGDFDGETVYEADLDPDKISHVPSIAQALQCSADYVLGLTDELHPAPEPTGQLVFNGWMPGGTTPATNGDVVAVFDLGKGLTKKMLCYWRGGRFEFLNGAKIDAEVIKWMALPPDEEGDA